VDLSISPIQLAKFYFMNKKKLTLKYLPILAVLFFSNLLIAQAAFRVISAGSLGMFIGSNISQPIRAMHVVGELNLTPNNYNNLTYLNISNPTGNMTSSTTQLFIRGLKSNGSQGSEVNIGTSGFMGVNGLPAPATIVRCSTSICANLRLQVFGNAASNGWYTFSDSSIKENIEPISNVLPELLKMHPISYNYKPVKLSATEGDTSSSDTIVPTTDASRRYGFTAQEVKRVFPILQKDYTETIGVVDYVSFVPLLVSGIQEQQKTIDSLNLQIQNLRQ
jgi:hypothetical protein